MKNVRIPLARPLIPFELIVGAGLKNPSKIEMKSMSSISNTAAPLESVLRTRELHMRPSRPPDYEAENRALTEVITALADSSTTIFQKLVEAALKVCDGDSAGICLLEDDGTAFYSPAVAGAWTPPADRRLLKDLPCGAVLERNAPQLFVHPERHYLHLATIKPPIEEALVIPFQTNGKTNGTIWVISQNKNRRFDLEDLRIMTSLARVAAAAYQSVTMLDTITQAEKSLRESNRRKDEFLAMLAHELRNPLTPIRNAAQILRVPEIDAATHQGALDMLDRQIVHMIRLVDDLLDASRISRGKIGLRKERTELSMIVQYAIETTHPLRMSRDHRLEIELPPQPIRLDADTSRLTQVVSNLLNNAYKFTPLGGRIRIAVEREDGSAVIRVQDNGIGIADEQLPLIFEMFTQADTSLERAQSGLGIGLSLVKNLVQMHGGTVEARSAGSGKGSEFIVRLPVIAQAAETARPQPDEPSVLKHAATPSRVLIVDDNRDSSDSLAELLKIPGHEVHTANDGLEAMTEEARFHPDVILLDIGLPELNGYEVARRIREQHKDNGPVIIAMTGWGQEEDRRRSREAGFNAHIVKPVDPKVLSKLLAELAAPN